MKPTTGNTTPCALTLKATGGYRAEPGTVYQKSCESLPVGRWEAARHLRIARSGGAKVQIFKRGWRWLVKFPAGRLAVSGLLAIRRA